MKASQRKKICWYCEGSVPGDALQCSFCGSDLSHTQKNSSTELLHAAYEEESLDESLASLYRPPYLARDRFKEKNTHSYIEESYTPRRANASFSSASHGPTARSMSKEGAAVKEEEEKISGNKDAFSLLFLSIGGFLMTLGLLLFFFSEEGVLMLKWNANYWFIYCFLSLPLLYFGFRFLGSLQQQRPSK